MEYKNSQLFKELAGKTTLSEIKSHLLKISQGDESHSEILLGLGDPLGSAKVNRKECKRKLQSVCQVSETV